MAKLVRDRIPEIITADNRTPVTHIAEEKEYWNALKKKLDEEVQEFLESEEIEELADVEEVLKAIYEFKSIPKERIEGLRKEKEEERGGFAGRIILDRIK